MNVQPETHIELVYADYLSVTDNGQGPFYPTLTVALTPPAQICHDQLTQEYLRPLLKLPGWDNDTSGYYSHYTVVRKNTIFVTLPRHPDMYGLTLQDTTTVPTFPEENSYSTLYPHNITHEFIIEE